MLEISGKTDCFKASCLVTLLIVVRLAGTTSVEVLKFWQLYIDNEQALALAGISQKGMSLSTVLHGLHNLPTRYSTCSSSQIQFDDTVTFHSIWTVCSYLQVSVLSSTSKDTHTLEIRAPKALGLNITTLKFESDNDMVYVCDKKIMAVQQENNHFDVICGNPYLERTSLVPHHNTTVFFRHQYHEESILMVNLHIQIIALLGKSIPILNYYSSIDKVREKHLFAPSLQSINGKYYGASVVSLTVSYDSMTRVNSDVPSVQIWHSGCNSDLSFAVFDGPYAGVLSTRGLVSPFELLVEGVCEDIPTSGYLSYNSSIGDLTVVVRHSLNPSTVLKCKFEYISPLCPGESCTKTTVEVAHDNLQKWSSVVPERPLLQIVKFISKGLDSMINLKLEVTEADVRRPSGYSAVRVVCPTEGIFIYEDMHNAAFVCSGEGFSNLNRTMQESGGLQFSVLEVTIILKMYPQTTKLKLNIWHTGTSCFGMINGCFYTPQLLLPNWNYNVGIDSCLPRFDIRGTSQNILYVHLRQFCCFQWHMITFEEIGKFNYYFDWQCVSHFYAPQNSLYQWHIALDDKQKQYDCLTVKYAATDYPLMHALQEPFDQRSPHGGMFVLDESRALISAYVHVHILAKCSSDTFGTGFKLTGTALNLTTALFCNSQNVSYRGEAQMETPAALSFIFEPFLHCADLHLSTLPINYSFMFNMHELKNNLYTFKRFGTCCFISLVFQARLRVAEGFQDQLGYAVKNDRKCDSFVNYDGIPQSLVLRHFSKPTFHEGFSIRKFASTSSYLIKYYYRERSQVQRHTYSYTKEHGCLKGGSCTVCTSRKCYNIYGYSSLGNFSWNEVNRICRHNGSELVSLNDEYEWSYIAQLLDALCVNNAFVHLGLGRKVCMLSVYILPNIAMPYGLFS